MTSFLLCLSKVVALLTIVTVIAVLSLALRINSKSIWEPVAIASKNNTYR